MGSNHSTNKINYEDMQHAALKKSLYKSTDYEKKYIIINTMEKNCQSCLIQNTIPIQEEEEIINGILKNTSSNNNTIIVYGMNSNDESIHTKYDQLVKLGIKNVFIYTGGMFEWLLLQDIYGRDLFPTTSRELDLLKYKPRKQLNILYIDT